MNVTTPSNMTVLEQLLLTPLSQADHIVVADSQRELTGQGLVTAVNLCAESLRHRGFKAGTPCLLRMTNTVASVVMLLAIIKAEGTVFVANPNDPVDRLIGTIERFGIGMVFANVPTTMTIQAKAMNRLGESQISSYYNDTYSALSLPQNSRPLALVDSAMRDAQVAIFSSGTTGQPKAILHSMENLLVNAKLHGKAVGLRQDDVVGGFLPVYYSYGLVANLLASLVTQAKIVFKDNSGQFDQHWANQHRVSVLALTPYFAQRLAVTVPSLRVMTFGGDALSSDAAVVLQQKFPNAELYGTYGLTEAGPRVATWRFDDKQIPSGFIVPLGSPLEGVTLELLSKDGQPADFGELVVTTPTRTLGYYNGVDAGYIMPDWPQGKVATGDLFFHTDGHFHFASRDKEMIIQNGEKLFPPMIEAIIRQIEGVIDVQVEGIFDPEKGEVAKANIHAEVELSINTIRKQLMQQLPLSSIPSQFSFVNQIARTSTGKKLRTAS